MGRVATEAGVKTLVLSHFVPGGAPLPDSLWHDAVRPHFSANQPPFYQGYAHEAAARAAKVGGDTEALAYHLGQAHQFAAQVEEADDRAVLESDLAELSG